ncbi:hypothetical protein ACLB0R_07090 [Sphingomonas sp. GlSt437]|uniref:hypothetical protein n=1 Tax=Sphingomonas sp. GlSt437 TaxID=3389970 RepID=UPI003A8A498C
MTDSTDDVPPDPDPTALFGKAHFGRYMRAQWSKKGETLADDARLGISIDELVRSSTDRNKKVEAPYIDLWIAILDEFGSWLVSLFSTVYRPAKERDVPMNDFEKSVVVLLGKLIADTNALRHLVTLGFDGSARTLLRSITEYIHVLVALIDDSALAKDFVGADTPETANAFYFRQLARGKLFKRLEAAWAGFFQSSGDAARWFADQQRRQGKMLSGTAHPSFAGGTQAVIGFIETAPDENWLGHWGAKSNMSVLTISLYADAFLPLVLLTDYPFTGFDGAFTAPINFDPEDEMHRHVKLGRSVLASLILSLNTESNIGHVYPPGFEPIESIEDTEADPAVLSLVAGAANEE